MLLLLHGTDSFATRELLTRILGDPRFAGNVERYDGATADLGAIRMACATLPFLSEARLVLVDGLPKPRRESGVKDTEPPQSTEPAETKGKRGSKKPSVAALAREFGAGLAALAAELPPSTTLVVAIDEELPKTHPLLEAAAKHGKIHLAVAPTGTNLDRWIDARVKSEGVAITPEASTQLAALTGGDSRLLANEINKLATYVGQGSTIDLPTVRSLVADNRETRVFALTDALAKGDRAAALGIAHELMSEGQAPLMLVSMIARQVRQLIQIKDLAARGARAPEIASATGMHTFVVEKTLTAARRFSFAQLEAAARSCLDVDTALKRSRMTPELAIDLLLTEFGQSATPPR